MGTLSDRLVMTLIATTALIGLGGYWVTQAIGQRSDWWVQTVLPILAVVALVVVVLVVWEGLDVMD